MGIFDGIEHVAAEGTSIKQYFASGNYQVTIDAIFLHEKRLGGGKLFIVETTVDDSDNPNIKPGERRNWVQSFSIPTALARIKSFIGAAYGLCPQRQLKEINSKITTAICNEAVSAHNPLRGKKLRLACVTKPTRAGKEFVQHIWSAHETR